MTNPQFTALRVAVDSGVATVTIDNPPLNLLDVALITDLNTFADGVRDDEAVKVIVVESADPEFFIAHGDAHFVDRPETFAALAEGFEGPLNPMQALHEKLRALPQITIGKIAGFARGGGHELLMALDLRFAAIGRAQVAQPEVLLGILPGGGGTQYLTRLTGRARALELLLGAPLVDAELAERYGLVNRAPPADELDDFVSVLARHIAGLPTEVIQAVRAAVDAALTGSYEDGLALENQQLGKLFTAEAAQRTVDLLKAGYQTREGEKRLEQILHG
ncbi:enoyl-CoA hydratase/isomerase family protein [Actinoplanes couchii]|uniref:Enoyl-CoA hydratase n=1 Tax=Actinoplanes couchii TaxID=403638 RepID=A0ABQ3XNN5_9ACTN|nr:enoyl-CoA hydratase/isomerase family protein [Actinoplanes couchii]MDR6319682.1 enoyl-CoA hydratase/carnithine racemase [Actinoplanes couchii]GID60098.1 enoyl-CoA hydratase [Actinoplanes couchii]